MRICFIVGARPNFMKAAQLFKAFESVYDYKDSDRILDIFNEIFKKD